MGSSYFGRLPEPLPRKSDEDISLFFGSGAPEARKARKAFRNPFLEGQLQLGNSGGFQLVSPRRLPALQGRGSALAARARTAHKARKASQAAEAYISI